MEKEIKNELKKKKIQKEVTNKLVDSQIKPHLKKLQKRTLASLSDLGIEEDIINKSAAALAIGKAVAEKKFKVKLNKNTELKVDANKDKESIGIFYKKGF